MSIATEIQRLQTAKADIKTAIEGKGVTVPSSTKLDGYASLIDLIQQGGDGLTNEVKQALLNMAQNLAYTTPNAQELYDALFQAFYPVASISASFNQGSNVIYDTDSLDDLKQYLTVTATYEGGTSEIVTNYTLNGTLTAGTSTIVVSYGGKTTTFNVTVTEYVPSQGEIFGTFTNGYAIGKATRATDDIPVNGIWNNSTTGRGAMTVPIVNNGYVITVTDTSKYNVAVYDVADNTEHSTTYANAVLGKYYQGGTKSISWKTTDSATTPYIMIALKKNSGSFTTAELANGAEAVFTYTSNS